MQDETTPPVPVKDVPTQGSPTPAQPVTQAPAVPTMPIKEAPMLKEEKVAVKEPVPSTPKHSSDVAIAPVVVAVLIFIGLAVCAYFVFKGM